MHRVYQQCVKCTMEKTREADGEAERNAKKAGKQRAGWWRRMRRLCLLAVMREQQLGGGAVKRQRRVSALASPVQCIRRIVYLIKSVTASEIEELGWGCAYLRRRCPNGRFAGSWDSCVFFFFFPVSICRSVAVDNEGGPCSDTPFLPSHHLLGPSLKQSKS